MVESELSLAQVAGQGSEFYINPEPGVANPLSLGEILPLIPPAHQSEFVRELVGPVLTGHPAYGGDRSGWVGWGEKPGDGIYLLGTSHGPSVLVRHDLGDGRYAGRLFYGKTDHFGDTLESVDSVSTRLLPRPTVGLTEALGAVDAQTAHHLEAEVLLNALAQHPSFRSIASYPLATVGYAPEGISIVIQGECGVRGGGKEELVRILGPFN